MPTDGKLGDTTAFVNSGLMGREAGQAGSFDLTFTAVGVYDYLCLVHGVMMSGTIEVVDADAHVASPGQVQAQGNFQIARQMAKAPAVVREAKRRIMPATRNPDGTMTHYVSLGFSQGQIDLMRFFPSKLLVRPGDTVKWALSPSDDAPHTVTFLNGEPEPRLGRAGLLSAERAAGAVHQPGGAVPVLVLAHAPDAVGPVQLGAAGSDQRSHLLLVGDRGHHARTAAVPVHAARHERYERHADRPAEVRKPGSAERLRSADPRWRGPRCNPRMGTKMPRRQLATQWGPGLCFDRPALPAPLPTDRIGKAADILPTRRGAMNETC